MRQSTRWTKKNIQATNYTRSFGTAWFRWITIWERPRLVEPRPRYAHAIWIMDSPGDQTDHLCFFRPAVLDPYRGGRTKREIGGEREGSQWLRRLFTGLDQNKLEKDSPKSKCFTCALGPFAWKPSRHVCIFSFWSCPNWWLFLCFLVAALLISVLKWRGPIGCLGVYRTAAWCATLIV